MILIYLGLFINIPEFRIFLYGPKAAYFPKIKIKAMYDREQ